MAIQDDLHAELLDAMKAGDAAGVVMLTVKGLSGWFWVVAIMAFAAGSEK